MRRYVSLVLIVSMIGLCYIPFHSSAMNLILPEKVLDERLIDDGLKEVFVQKGDGDYYRIVYELVDDRWMKIEEEKIEFRKTGLIEGNQSLIKDPDLDDALHNQLDKNELSSLPSSVDYSNSSYLPIVGEQFENSCVGWSVGYYLRTYQQAQDLGWTVKEGEKIVENHVFSSGFVYNQINEGIDEGSTLEDAGILLETVGAATLADFPYIPGDYQTQPSQEVMESASPHKIRDWKILYTPNDSKEYVVGKTKEYLMTGDLPIISIKVGFKWHYPMEQDGHSIITTEQYPMYGHAVAIVGYDDSIETPEGYGAFKIVNSWGTQWGDNGFAYLSYDALYNNMMAGYAYTDLVNGPMLGDLTAGTAHVLSPKQVKYTWDAAENAEGYKVLDESYRVIANVYTNEYVETFTTPQKVTRYIQAFNSTSTSNLLKIEADTVTVIKDELPALVQDDVVFTMNFNGSGQYRMVMKNLEGKMINEIDGLQATLGQNTIRWNAVDQLGKQVPDGTYKVEFYQEDKLFHEMPFTKESKVKVVESQVAKIGDYIQEIHVELIPHTTGSLSVILVNNGQETVLADNINVTANKSFTYQVTEDQYDFSKNDPNKAELKINLK